MKKLLREPLLHFFAIGALLFAFNFWREKARPAGNAPEKIEVNAAVIERLRAGYERQRGVAPDGAELRGLVNDHIREEVLCREALALGLDRNDTIVRRRLAQKMEFLTADIASALSADDAAVREFFDTHAARYAKPGLVSFRHIFFSQQKHGEKTTENAHAALAALARGVSDETLGDPFLHGYVFAEREHADVVAAFGPEFAGQLAKQAPGGWHGPAVSGYGLHLVRVEARQESRPSTFTEVKETVLRDFNEERRETANREVFEKMCAHYEVAVDESALEQAAAIKTAQR